MSFIADPQTLEDLNITGRFKSHSVYRIFDRVVTNGGRNLLDHMFRYPLTDADAINQRCSVFRYFGEKAIAFPFTQEAFSIMENYLGNSSGNHLASTATQVLSKKALSIIAQDTEYSLLAAALQQTIASLQVLRNFVNELQRQEPDPAYREQLQCIHHIFQDKRLQWLPDAQAGQQPGLLSLIRYHHLLRVSLRDEMKVVTDFVFQLDVNVAVAAAAVAKGFCYPRALPREHNTIRINGLYHPSLEKAVANNVTLHQESNVLFLTGANMAGKSTLMKSFGIAVYLAHMGFPVAAQAMEFSVKDGLFSSINVPDDLGHGYSHFYAEVLRVKKVAEEVSASRDLVVIFDELFKGTNVKDAYDATLAITEAFSENRNCFFIISTHIIEVGEALRERCQHFQFLYLPTVMEGVTPRYTYQLKEGITSDRQGMLIIENEGIVELLGG